MAADPFPVLDPAELKRIQAMHRGFLYQHLYEWVPFCWLEHQG